MPFIRVRKHYLHIPYLTLGLIEFFLYLYAVAITSQLKAKFYPQILNTSTHLSEAIIFALVMSCCTLAMGSYGSLVREGTMSIVFRILISFCLLGSLCISILSLLFPDTSIDTDTSFWATIISMAFAFIARVTFVFLVDAKKLCRHVVIYGAGQKAQKIIENYEQDRSMLAISIFGCIPIDNKATQVDATLVLEPPDSWASFCKKNHITEIIIAPDEMRRSQGAQFPIDELMQCKMQGVAITEALNFYERELNKVEHDSLKPSWLIYSDGFNISKSRDCSKRFADITISVILGFILSPLCLLAALLILTETGRPIFYHQIRVGKDGKSFRIYKFRSMTQNAESEGKAVWAQKNDTRVTQVGKFLRNTRIDEIPQLYNVLKGEMSFVGPRPERPEFVDDLSQQLPFYQVRHQVKPGLMGWAQLKYPYGASVEDAKNKLEYDLYYTKNHSFLMDILIMFQTVEIVLLGKGVH